ncbi:DUF2953 domain-containing protein [Clostridium sp. MSJ-4]|uniref:DUF2953 domain-containing protein n=1 Tax=Clostridium simiarum TaxID=2841506 RepID=A0ABS6EWX6_9CLOT|nr:DUF2953 domain-containing protein [Clostridium simiarum]MBU5590732.1 DUF2953 domain-containing protein [Clostridium simiarum]
MLNIFLLILLLLFIILIFFPFPIKLNLKYKENKLSLSLYKKNIEFNKGKAKSFIKKTKSKKNKHKKVFMLILNKYKCSKLKHKISIDVNMGYGLDDAAVTAVAYGVLNSFFYTLYVLLQDIFNIKDYNIDLEPYFNKNSVDIKICCIIYTNLVQIINVLLIYKRSLKEVKAKEL